MTVIEDDSIPEIPALLSVRPDDFDIGWAPVFLGDPDVAGVSFFASVVIHDLGEARKTGFVDAGYAVWQLAPGGGLLDTGTGELIGPVPVPLDLAGNRRDNRLTGDIYDDILKGRNGDDRFEASYGDDLVKGGKGRDLAFGGEGGDRLIGGAGRDRLFGEGGDDVILGGAGNDYLVTGTGEDVLKGGAGNDVLYMSDGEVHVLNGGRGSDTAKFGNSVTAALIVPPETVMFLSANPMTASHLEYAPGAYLVSIENLTGSNGADRLCGDLDSNRLKGRGGDDILFGSLGNDILHGGAGSDAFRFAQTDGRDVVRDFVPGEDVVQLIAGYNVNLDGTPAPQPDSFEVAAHGGGSLISFGETGIILRGVTPDQLDEGNILLGGFLT